MEVIELYQMLAEVVGNNPSDTLVMTLNRENGNIEKVVGVGVEHHVGGNGMTTVWLRTEDI